MGFERTLRQADEFFPGAECMPHAPAGKRIINPSTGDKSMHPALRSFTSTVAVLLLGLVALGFDAPSRAAEPAPAPHVPDGGIVQLERVPSQYVAPHNVDVWLPPG